MLAAAMNVATSSHPARAFTLLELLVVIAIVAVLTALFLPGGSNKSTARAALCMNNLRQVGLAFRQWSPDQHGTFPTRRPADEGGTKELAHTGQAFVRFRVLSNELSYPKVLVCPADTKTVAPDFGADFSDANVSYSISY
jgi:prepilin-type N-terminal cleavage/methylation domain-containing protein